MYTIRNYTDTRCELEMAKTRLSFLMDKKERLYRKYFPVTSKIKEVMSTGNLQNNDKMAEYLSELHDIDVGTGKSLADEISYQQINVDNLQKYINIMNNTMSELNGIEYQLYYEIVVLGINITKAVENVASKNNKDTRTIWKHYYPKIKKDVKKVRKFIKVQ